MPNMCKIFCGTQKKHKAFEYFTLTMDSCIIHVKRYGKLAVRTVQSWFPASQSWKLIQDTGEWVTRPQGMLDWSSGPPAMSSECVNKWAVCQTCALWGKNWYLLVVFQSAQLFTPVTLMWKFIKLLSPFVPEDYVNTAQCSWNSNSIGT